MNIPNVSTIVSVAFCLAPLLFSACSESGGGADSAAGEQEPTFEASGWAEVTHFNTYTDIDESAIAIAVVKNVLDTPLKFVDVAMLLRDGEGVEIERKGGQISRLPPGASMPVKVIFDDAGQTEWASVEPLVWRADKEESSGIYTGLTLEGVKEQAEPPNSYVYQVTGKVINSGSAVSDFITVAAAFFNEQDELMAVGFGGTSGELAPGDAGDFTVGTNTAAGPISRAELTVMGNTVE